MDNNEAQPVAKPPGSSKPASTNRDSLLGPSSASRGLQAGVSPTPTAAVPQATKTPNSRFRRLTTEETADHRLKGLCFNCPKKFSKDHASKCSMKGIYLLELDDAENSDNSSDEVEISLYDLVGIRMGKTMQLQVEVQDEKM